MKSTIWSFFVILTVPVELEKLTDSEKVNQIGATHISTKLVKKQINGHLIKMTS